VIRGSKNASKLKYRPQHYKYQLGSRQNEDSSTNKSIKCILVFIWKTVIASFLHTHTHKYLYTHTNRFTHKNYLSKFLTLI
jgi:hypothetical protein